MEARSNWPDDRLDDLNDRVKSLEGKVDAGFARLDGRIDQMNHTMVQGMIALISIITVLLSILVGIVATKLF
jgi:hypothetical protein